MLDRKYGADSPLAWEAMCFQIKFWSSVYLQNYFVSHSNCCYQANKQRFEVVVFIDVSLGSHSQSVLSEFSYWAQATAIICICVFSSSLFCQTLWPEWPGISGWGISPEFAVDERQWYTRYPRSHIYCKWRSFRAGLQVSSFLWCFLLLDKHLFGQKNECSSMLLWTCI